MCVARACWETQPRAQTKLGGQIRTIFSLSFSMLIILFCLSVIFTSFSRGISFSFVTQQRFSKFGLRYHHQQPRQHYEMSSFMMMTDFSVATTLGDAALHRDLKASVRLFLPEWQRYDDKDIEVAILLGGLTNSLYTLTPQNDIGKKVIVRVYGEGTSLFVDRAIENTVFEALSDAGVATKFLGAFQNGRVEGYLNATNLTPDQMAHPALYPKIASAVAQLHTKHIQGITETPYLWEKLTSFFDLAESSMDQKLPKEGKHDFRDQLKILRKELEWLEGVMSETESHVKLRLSQTPQDRQEEMTLRGIQFATDTVLCHNDLLSGNILLSNNTLGKPRSERKEQNQCNKETDGFDEEKKTSNNSSDQLFTKDFASSSSSLEGFSNGMITLIDFEYAGYNPRGFDVANHFNEYAGFDFNIIKDFPSRDIRRAFITSYLLATVNANHSSTTTSTAVSSSAAAPSLSAIMSNEQDLSAFIDGFESMICKYTLASHLLWGVWATIQSVLSHIDFDFGAYALLRFNGYYYHKQVPKL